jgi:hypothetical protein
MYFNQNELEEVFSNIRRLLKKYGGSWIIVDRAYYMHDQSIAKAILGDDSGALAMYRAVQSQGSENASDVKTFDNAIFKGDDDEVKAFINRMGFAVREICMADFLPEQIVSLNGNPEADSAVRDVFKKMMFWELTVAENTVVKTADSNLPFKVASEVKNGVFDVSIQGRMDTITAPELLKQF